MKQKNLAKVLIALIILMSRGFNSAFVAHAAASGTVVMNEVAWAGSADSSTDEWIELYNTSAQSVDLSGWYIDDDHGASTYKITGGSIAAHDYFLIEDHETTVSTITADAIIDVSLANNGDSLQLYDPSGQLIDTVNDAGGAWAAGNATSKATMERLDPLASGDLASNWATSTGSGDKASGGSNIIGTPRRANSAGSIQPPPPVPGSPTVDLNLSAPTPQIGDVLTTTVKIANASNLFAYGFDLSYDPAVLHFKSAAANGFLSENGTVASSFQAALENGTEGKLVLAEARTTAVKTGVSGDGNLLTIQFEVAGGNGNTSNLHFGAGSFLANPNGDFSAQLNDQTFTPQAVVTLDAVTNLQIVAGTDRYSLQLSWSAAAGAQSYRAFRQDVHGQWQLLQESAALTFTDKDGVNGGGFIVPDQDYNYRVVAVNAQTESGPAEATQKDSRGLKSDNNRSDRTDGRDLEQLAHHFGESDVDQGFDPLIDTTYDGRIDGSDLIDLGANFARTYTP